MNGSDQSEGRVEICINNAWGTVCNNLFSKADAQVVCTQLGGFYRKGTVYHMHFTHHVRHYRNFLLSGSVAYREPRFGPGSGPIFLDEVHCSGTEMSLLECDMFAPVGVHMCVHSQDVGVHCEGTYVTLTA